MHNSQEAMDYSAKWLEIIKKDTEELEISTARWISEETKNNFVNHFNAGWVEYRKSMTEAGDYGAVEWRGKGARFYDNFGTEYYDFLGGYGALDLGWSHPEVVDAVRSQALRSGIPSQELMDPLRGVLARLISYIAPGDIDHAFFVASGTEAVEGALKIARLHTGKHNFHFHSESLSRKNQWVPERNGQKRVSWTAATLCNADFLCPFRGCRCPRKTARNLRNHRNRHCRVSWRNPSKARRVQSFRPMITGQRYGKFAHSSAFC